MADDEPLSVRPQVGCRFDAWLLRRRDEWRDGSPHWPTVVIEGLVLVLLLGGLLTGVAIWAEYRRADQAELLEEERAREAERLENLRFVRSTSSIDERERPFRGMDVRGMNLSALRLADADFTDAVLADAVLTGADLSDVELHRADLSGARLDGADLSEATLSDAILVGANLVGADLVGANLINADLSNVRLCAADLTRADLDGAELAGATYDLDTVWPEGFDPDSVAAIERRTALCILGIDEE